MERAAIYITTYPEVVAIDSELLQMLSAEKVERLRKPRDAVPFDLQARACRAYGERMGYSIFHIYRVDVPPPENVERPYRLRITPGDGKEPFDAEVIHEYNSRHPYDWIRNLLETKSIDNCSYIATVARQAI
jgi:hypothetical protein